MHVSLIPRSGLFLLLSLSSLSLTFSTDAAPKPRTIENFVDPSMPEFVPSNEWQEVKPGQAIPSGLHIRSNLQTGKTEAKLMDNTKESVDMNKLPAVVSQPEPESTPQDAPQATSKRLKHEELAKALKGVMEGHDNLQFEKTVKDVVKEKKYKSYESLKKDFEAMNMHVKSDHEIIAELVRLLNSSTDASSGVTENVRLNLLSDLEYYLHQIDNAQHLADNGGIEWMVRQLSVPSNSIPVKSQFLFAMSAALHSNIKVQIHALNSNLLPQLDKLLQVTLSNFTSPRDVAVAQMLTLYSRLVGVLGGLLQQFPSAQIQWLQSGGLEALGAAYDRLEELQNLADLPLPQDLHSKIITLQVKMLTLVGDLQDERTSAEKYEKQDKNGVERQKQYATSNFAKHLLTSSWCQRLQKITLRLVSEKYSSHDTREKILHVLHSLAPLCNDSSASYRGWQSAELARVLQTLSGEYEQLAKSEETSGGGFFTDMFQLVGRTRRQVHTLEDEL